MQKAKKIDRATQHPAQAVRILFLLSDAELPTGKRPPLVSQLDVFIGSDGLIRCNGRLANAQF
jgi:hypothetical protein